jgi:eukaryotic-like serine/threonine-protein kinase
MIEPSNSEVTVFSAARRLPVRERAAYLDEACAGDAVLRQRVEELLQVGDEAGAFLNNMAPGVGGTVRIPGIPAEKAGDHIGRYKLLQQIGEGGCGMVYMAEQEEPVRRRVALKVIKLGMDTKSVIARFEAERQALALMDHPNIAKVLDAGATDTGRPYFVMELVRGIKITDYCDENNLNTPTRLQLFIQVCQAIQHAHQKGVIHRDIKPSNILVTVNDGVPVPKVIDFGIAKATQGRLTDKTLFTAFEQFIGTPAYMSPEQAVMTSLDIDTRSDIYSLGVLLYELLTGQTPFNAQALLQSGLDAMRRTIREVEPPKPSARLSTMLDAERASTASQRQTEPPKLIHLLKGDLDWIVMKCLEKDRGRRYETASGLTADIQRHLNTEPIVARPPTGLYRLQKSVRRNKGAFAAATVIALVLLIGVVVSTWQAVRATRAVREQVRLRQQAETDEKKAQVEAAQNRQTAQFLRDMLVGIGPNAALGRDTTMLREILDKTAERADKDLTNQPLVEADLQNTIGWAYGAIGEYGKAEAILRESVVLRRNLLGNESRELADSLETLGWILFSEWKLTEAEATDREALAIRKKLYAPPHLELADSLDQLGCVLRREDKQLDEAEEMIRQGLTMRRQLLGNENPYVINSLDNLGEVMYHQNKLDEDEATLREALAIARRLYGNQHPSVLNILCDLGGVLMSEGRLAEAEDAERESLAQCRRFYGDEQYVTANGAMDLGEVLAREGRFSEAEPLFREALTIDKKWLGKDHIRMYEVLEDLAGTLQSRGELAESEALFRESLAIHEKQQPENWVTFDCRSMLGGNLLAQKKYAEAEPLLVSGFEGIKQREQRIPIHRRESLGKALARLVELCEATNRPDQAAQWKQKLADFDKAETGKKAGTPQSQAGAITPVHAPQAKALIEDQTDAPATDANARAN